MYDFDHFMIDIFIACDHAAFALKENILVHNNKEINFIDKGCYKDKSCDYPEYAFLVVEEILKGNASIGVLLCNTGIGMSISANRFQNIRAALCFNSKMAVDARIHNDANVLCMGSSIVTFKDAIDIIKNFANTRFLNEERHIRRIEKYNNLGGKPNVR